MINRRLVMFFAMLLSALKHLFSSRGDLLLENLALRQQLAILTRERPAARPDHVDRSFWVAMSKQLSHWAEVIVIVKPATVVRWHRQGFRYYWRWKSRHRKVGRPKLDREVRQLIRRLALDNLWRAPRIQKELVRLGFELHPDTVRRYMPKLPPDVSKRATWIEFLRNHMK